MTNFKEDLYTAAYMSLFTGQNQDRSDCGVDVELADYGKGYTLLLFDASPQVEGTEQSTPRFGNVKLDLRFREALNQAVNVILYSTVDSVLYIDQARDVKIPD